jgi:glycosyltransferase involved in cell wall biosynthesis
MKGKRDSFFSQERYDHVRLISFLKSMGQYNALYSEFSWIVFIYYVCREWGYFTSSIFSGEIRRRVETALKPNGSQLYETRVSCVYTSKFKKDKMLELYNSDVVNGSAPFADFKKEVVEYLLETQSKKKLSIVIPFFNRESFITKQFIESYRRLIEPFSTNVELIFVDDGSTDNTLAMLQSISTHFPCGVVIIHHANKGPSGARNSGFRAARGEYVLFADSDVFLYPGTLERLLLPFFMDRELVVSGGIQLSRNPHTIFDRWRNDHVYGSPTSFIFHISNSIGLSNDPHDTAILLVKKISEDQTMFDETYKLPGYEDIEYVYRIKRGGGKCASVPVIANNQRSLRGGHDFRAQALARQPGLKIFLNQYKEDNLDFLKLAHTPNIFVFFGQTVMSLSVRSFIPLLHFFYSLFLRVDGPQSSKGKTDPVFLGKGTTFNVFKISPTRVVKVKHSLLGKMQLLFSGLIILVRKKRFKFLVFFFFPYNIFGKKIGGEKEAINFILTNPVLNKQFGYPTLSSKGVEQDYVVPIINKIPELDDFEYHRLLMEYVEGVYCLWSFGYFEMVFFFHHNVGLDLMNRVVFMDLNEITSDKKIALRFLRHKMFNELISSINNPTKQDMTRIVFNEYFTVEAFHKYWESNQPLK